ncbi:MAG: endonuclease/exonuclease/phosphatase family protein [Acidimicrobiia bacterium]
MRRTRGSMGAVAFAVATIVATPGVVPTRATATTADSTPQVEIVSQNVLHGLACPEASNHCRVGDRMKLFTRNLAAADCPQIVAMQEANREVVRRLRGPLRRECGDDYTLVFDDAPGLDREVVLTTLPVLGRERIRLAGPLRSALWVRVKAPVGAVDLLATHLASDSDDRPCDSETCPPPCEADDSLQTCQAREAVAYLDDRRSRRTVGVLVGDLNAGVGEPTISVLRDAGYIDTHLAAANPECDPTTAQGCTGGRDDTTVESLSDPTSRQEDRIDYVFLAPTPRCEVVAPTGLFDAEPATDDPSGLAYVSDHTGVEATIACTTTRADLAAARRIRTTTTTTVPPPSGTVPASVEQQVTEAYETLFGGAVTDPDEKLAVLQGAAVLRDSFIARMQSVGDLANRTGVQIESITPAGRNAVDLVFTITLDGSSVLDQLPGQAVRVDGRWLVARRSYCQVATLGLDTAPDGCR